MKSAIPTIPKIRKQKIAAKETVEEAPKRLQESKQAFLLTHGNGATKPTHEQVRAAAYLNYLNEGCPEGRALQHWLAAENQLLAH